MSLTYVYEENIAKFEYRCNQVNVKATTEEGLGFTGKERVFLPKAFAY